MNLKSRLASIHSCQRLWHVANIFERWCVQNIRIMRRLFRAMYTVNVRRCDSYAEYLSKRATSRTRSFQASPTWRGFPQDMRRDLPESETLFFVRDDDHGPFDTNITVPVFVSPSLTFCFLVAIMRRTIIYFQLDNNNDSFYRICWFLSRASGNIWVDIRRILLWLD